MLPLLSVILHYLPGSFQISTGYILRREIQHLILLSLVCHLKDILKSLSTFFLFKVIFASMLWNGDLISHEPRAVPFTFTKFKQN